MPRAYILLNVESGFEDLILKQLKKLNEVTEAYVSYGTYDLIIRIKTETMDQLKNSVTHNIRSIDHVRSTLTLMIMEE